MSTKKDITETSGKIADRSELEGVISLIVKESKDYLFKVDEKEAWAKEGEKAFENFNSHMPAEGKGAVFALNELVKLAKTTSIASSGPRAYHFVIGGNTPASLGADWFTSVLDQNNYSFVSSPLGTKLEELSIRWLLDLFDLPNNWFGVVTTGATMANFTCLTAARQWYGEKIGVNIAQDGFKNIGKIPIFVSGIIHPSDIKALGMLGFGRASAKVVKNTETETFDLVELERQLKDLNGAPSIIIGVAGEPNAGLFDQIPDLALLAEKYNAWFHVDGAFGLFARVLDKTKYLVNGLEKAHSVAVDGHKWLNVPYDTGFSFVNDVKLLGTSFASSAAYLAVISDLTRSFGSIGPEMSRRARAIPVWATLYAYGRKGVISIIEQSVNLAKYLSDSVNIHPELEELEPTRLNIVCFRYNPRSKDEEQLNKINKAIGDDIEKDGRVFMGITTYKGSVALRPAVVNWRTRKEDMDLLLNVVLELGRKFSTI